MKIGIIGTGNIGKTLVRKLTQAGHFIQMANSREPETLKHLAEETGAKALTAADAVKGVDVVILSIPFNRISGMKEILAGLPDGVVIADTSNYASVRDGDIESIDNGQAESEWVSEQIGRPVIKAWNNVLAETLVEMGLPAGAEGRIALSVAGDDPAAKKIIMSLVEETGFDAIDGGSLAESWRQQIGTPAFCTELAAAELQNALAAADCTRAPELREEIIKKMVALGDKVTKDAVVRLNRTLTA